MVTSLTKTVETGKVMFLANIIQQIENHSMPDPPSVIEYKENLPTHKVSAPVNLCVTVTVHFCCTISHYGLPRCQRKLLASTKKINHITITFPQKLIKIIKHQLEIIQYHNSAIFKL